MTENEAIKRIRYRIDTATDIIGKGVDGKAYEDMEIAVKALEEIQEYRSISTVEKCRAAVEKQRAKKPNIGNDNGRQRKCCSVCGCFYSPTSKYCPKCGHAILYEDGET